MNLDFLKNSLRFIFLIAIFSFVSIGIVWIYNFNAIDNYMKSEEVKAIDNISRMDKQILEISNILFDTVINKPTVINIFKDAYLADDISKDIIRKKLYDALKDEYILFQKYHVEQLHFHLPNLDSFLRFHRPKIYGDNLKNIRQTVVYVSKNKKPTHSFEEGKTYNGFRYVYPLFNDNIYIGSVEISHSYQSYKSIYEGVFEDRIDFVIRKDIVESKVFTSQLDNYYEYPLNKNFFVQRSIKMSTSSRELWKNLMKDKDVIKKMNNMEQFSTYVYHTQEHHYHVVSFIPITNIHTNKKVAYSIVNEPSEFLDTIMFNFQMQVAISLFVSILLAYIVYREINAKSKMKKLLHQVSEVSKKNRVIINLSHDMIITIENDVIIDVNEKFLDFYAKKDLQSLGVIKDNIENLFLCEDGCFSVNSSKGKAFWIKDILQLEYDQRVVAILDRDINKRFFMLHISVLNQQNNEYLISFEEVTKTRMKHQLLEKQAYYDNLTQIYNRNFFMKKFLEINNESNLEGTAFSLIMFDIDFFKEVNDTYGHDVGDKSLIFLSEIVKRNIRENDTFARWGGEEFMLVVNSNLTDAIKISENLRKNIERATTEDETIPSFTCSFGVISLQESKNIEDLFKRVDIKLYEAKNSGRNKVISS